MRPSYLPSLRKGGAHGSCVAEAVADAEREWAYDRQSHIGRLDEATAKGWTVVDVKCDWSKVFAFEP
jgi:hypothetical protein